MIEIVEGYAPIDIEDITQEIDRLAEGRHISHTRSLQTVYTIYSMG